MKLSSWFKKNVNNQLTLKKSKQYSWFLFTWKLLIATSIPNSRLKFEILFDLVNNISCNLKSLWNFAEKRGFEIEIVTLGTVQRTRWHGQFRKCTLAQLGIFAGKNGKLDHKKVWPPALHAHCQSDGMLYNPDSWHTSLKL